MAFNTSETWRTVRHACMLSINLKGRLLPALARFSLDEGLAISCKKLHGRDRKWRGEAPRVLELRERSGI